MHTLRKHNKEGKIAGGTINYYGSNWVDLDDYYGRVKMVTMDDPILKKFYGETSQ